MAINPSISLFTIYSYTIKITLMSTKPVVYNNPNTFAGLVGRVKKILPKEEGRKGGEKKKLAQRARGGRVSDSGPVA